jgi:hypothetical protein
MARGTEDRECNDWEQHCVQSGNHRHASDPRVTEHLRDIHRRKSHAREYIARRRLGVEGPEARKKN